MSKPSMQKRDDISDHDLLIRVDEKLDSLCRWKNTHSKRHWAIELTIITLMVAYLIAKYV